MTKMQTVSFEIPEIITKTWKREKANGSPTVTVELKLWMLPQDYLADVFIGGFERLVSVGTKAGGADRLKEIRAIADQVNEGKWPVQFESKRGVAPQGDAAVLVEMVKLAMAAIMKLAGATKYEELSKHPVAGVFVNKTGNGFQANVGKVIEWADAQDAKREEGSPKRFRVRAMQIVALRDQPDEGDEEEPSL